MYSLVHWGTSSSGTLRSGSPSPGAVRYTQLRYTLQIQWGTPYKYSEVHPAEVQWGTPSWGAVSGRSASHANLRPVTALHCARLLDSTLEILWIVWIVWYLHFCHLALHSSWKKNCKAVSNKLMRNARPTQQRRKLKCSLFPKRKFVKLFRRETCCLPLQVNCHILVELRFSDRSVQNREVYSNLTLSSPTQGLSVRIVQVWIDEPELWVTNQIRTQFCRLFGITADLKVILLAP